MQQPQIDTQAQNPSKPDSDGFVYGYSDIAANGDLYFLGSAPYMTLIPGLVPSKFHVQSGQTLPTANPMHVPRGQALITEAGFGGQETILSGAVPDVGSGIAPTGAVAVPNLSPELQAKIAARKSEPAKSE